MTSNDYCDTPMMQRQITIIFGSAQTRGYKWSKNYALVASGETFVLVARPDDVIGVAVADETVDMDTVKRIIYLRRHILK